MKRIRGLLFLISSCFPGCGQMYQGYMKRGLSLMMIFCAVFLLTMFLNLEYLLILFIPLWLYSFFDSYNLRTQTQLGAAPEDHYLFGVSLADSDRLAALFRKRHSFIGWGLVVFGTYALYDRVMRRLVSELTSWFPELGWLHSVLVFDIPRILMSIGIIALGVWFIRGPKAAPAEEIPSFTPPTEVAQPEEAPDAELEVAHEQQ